MSRTGKIIIFYLLLPLFVACVLVFIIDRGPRTGSEVALSFYDIGQGDATFIQTYLGNQILIDGGPDNSILDRLGEDMPFYDHSIDMLVLTHPHADHMAGFNEILKRYEVKKVLLPDVEFDSKMFEEFLKTLEDKHIEKVFAKEGTRIYLDTATVLDIYFPEPGHFVADEKGKGLDTHTRDPNDVSIIAKLSFGKTQVLFTGDAGFDVENAILPKYNLDSDILKVGHHGSKYSSSDAFLQEVTPEYAIMSLGADNKYGHPSTEAMENLKEVNAKIFRTDQDGTVRFTSDGTTVQIR